MSKPKLSSTETTVLFSLLLKLGMEGAAVVSMLQQHGVTEAQTAESDAAIEIDVNERIAELGGGPHDAAPTGD